MNNNLSDYLLIFTRVIPEDTCSQAINQMQKNDWKQHTFYNLQTQSNETRSGNQELDVSYSEGQIENTIAQFMNDSYLEYIKRLDLAKFIVLENASYPRFNKYGESKKMAMHVDHIKTLFDGKTRGIPILTSLAILNEDYEGGELVFWNDFVIYTNVGDILVWPSLFLYPHRVEPVTKGERYSAVSWAW